MILERQQLQDFSKYVSFAGISLIVLILFNFRPNFVEIAILWDSQQVRL